MIRRVLNQIWLFEGMDPDSLDELAARFREERLGEYQNVYRLGQAADRLFIIRTGGVALIHDAVGRPVRLLARLGEKDFFGENGLLEGSVRTSTARTTEPSRLLIIDRESLLAFLDHQPLLRLKLRRASIERHSSFASEAAAGDSTRREVRITIDREVALRPEGGGEIRCRLDNLSVGGAAIDGAPDDWHIRNRVAFRLGLPARPDLLDVTGVVTWRKGKKVGIAFRDPTPALRSSILRALQVLLEGHDGAVRARRA